jgi:hypothetical protein
MIAQRIQVGLRRYPFRWIVEASVVYAAAWSGLEPLFGLLGLAAPGESAYATLVVLSLVLGVWRALPPLEVSGRIAGSNTTVMLSFGNIFATTGVRCVPVNEFFDSELGSPVSPHSLHGQLLATELGGHPDAFDRQVAIALADARSTSRQRAKGKPLQYAIGTTAELDVGGTPYILFALAHTDPVTNKASATVNDMWQALDGLWSRARDVSNGRTIVVPLVGGGLSGVGLPPQHLLVILLVSFASATKAKRVGSSLHVVLHESLFPDLDLRAAFSLLA